MKYPKENIVILCHLKNGGRTKGFFYMNGMKPTFASYGMDITESVIDWEYITQKELKVGDTVYQCDGFRIYLSTIQNIYFHNGRTIYDTEGISFDKRAIGSSVFTSREEAERLLFIR